MPVSSEDTLVARDLEVLKQAVTWRRAGRRVALATVVETWGSAPRNVGSHLAIRDDQHFVGSVSGGCVEGAVIRAVESLPPGQGVMLEYGVSNDQAWEVGLACGGRIRVWLQDLASTEVVSAAVDALERRAPAVLVFSLSSSTLTLVDSRHPSLGTAATEALRTDRPRLVEDEAGEHFLRPLTPSKRLYVIGAVHIASALVPMARLADWEVTLVDPRRGFAAAEKWPGVEVIVDYPDDAFAQLGLDARTAVVALTHDPKIDDCGLDAAMSSGVLYIGALGSKKTHAKRLDRLREAGFSDDQLATIRGPIGLNIGASTPAEIAVSILAELTQVLRERA